MPVPNTHRFFGRSIADLVMPVQREKTALKRGALDNLLTARADACPWAQYLEIARDRATLTIQGFGSLAGLPPGRPGDGSSVAS
jgi:hypothetical protein